MLYSSSSCSAKGTFRSSFVRKIMCLLRSSLSLTAWVYTFLAAAGCATPGPPPRADESDYFHTSDSGFHIEAREGIVRFQVALMATEAVNGTLFYTAKYENPASPDEPHVEEGEFSPEETVFFLESPPLEGLVAGRFYEIELELFEEAERSDLLDTHEIIIFSNIDTRRHEN